MIQILFYLQDGLLQVSTGSEDQLGIEPDINILSDSPNFQVPTVMLYCHFGIRGLKLVLFCTKHTGGTTVRNKFQLNYCEVCFVLEL